MKCHIEQNGGFMFLIVSLWFSIVKTSSQKVYTIQEFCSENQFIHNIEVGDTYQLVIKSEPTAENDKWYQKSKRTCLREYKTSDSSAHFIVDITDMNIPSCSDCRCNYFEIFVREEYKKKYCGRKEHDSFSSKSDIISIDFRHGFQLGFDVTLTFTVERNFYAIVGTPTDQKNAGGSYLETPYFPNPYPAGYRAEYLLRSDDPQSHVVLLFLDFQISNHSFVEVEGNDGTHLTRILGSTLRPPVIVSKSNQLNVKFQSNNELNRPGFRALVSFVRTVDSLSVPYTDCGGLKHGRGGNMYIVTHDKFSLYDCVWHIMLPFIAPTKLNLSISVNLRDVGHKSNLEFRNGHNSKSDVIRNINCEIENCSHFSNEMIVPTSSDLYIRFSGYLDFYSEVNISYSTYHTGNCSDREFTCDGGRCLLQEFRCDGVKQCPGGEDEQQCSTTAEPGVEVSSILSTKLGTDQDSSTTRIFFVLQIVGIFGLVAVVVALFFIYKFRKVRAASVEQAQLRAAYGGGLLGVLPTYYPHGGDSPPSYEDFIKSSDCYPPLLYTRAQRCIMPKDPGIDCTTSFCSSFRTRFSSSESSDRRGSTADGTTSWNSSREAPRHPSSNLLSVEISRPVASTTDQHIKRWYSLDSKLNDLVKQGTCHLFLSIIHPVCDHAAGHTTLVQCHSLPPNYKISTGKCAHGDLIKLKEPVWLPAAPGRRSWSFVPQSSRGSTDLLTVVKARCCSDPCQGMRIHYSE